MRAIRRNQARRGSGRVRAPGPTGVTQRNQTQNFQSIRPELAAAHCHARKDARRRRQAIPKRRWRAFDDRVVLIASPAS